MVAIFHYVYVVFLICANLSVNTITEYFLFKNCSVPKTVSKTTFKSSVKDEMSTLLPLAAITKNGTFVYEILFIYFFYFFIQTNVTALTEDKTNTQ